jgi:hypothetical protein
MSLSARFAGAGAQPIIPPIEITAHEANRENLI